MVLKLLPASQITSLHKYSLGLQLMSKVLILCIQVFLVLLRHQVILVKLVKVIAVDYITSKRESLLSKTYEGLRKCFESNLILLLFQVVL